MTLEIIDIFMQINRDSEERPSVIRYSKNNNTYSIDVAEIKDDIFEDATRETNWDWIPENITTNNENKTYWSSLIVSTGEFDDMFKPETLKAESDTFSTFKDFRESIEKMGNLSVFLKPLNKSTDVTDDSRKYEKSEETTPIKFPVKVSDSLSINEIIISDEHKKIIDKSGKPQFFGYVELGIIDNKTGVSQTIDISTDLYFDTIIFDPKKSPWEFIKNSNELEQRLNKDLIEQLSSSKSEIQKLLKMANKLD